MAQNLVIGIMLDLMFSSKVKEVASRNGFEFRNLKKVEQAIALELTPTGVVVNLEADRVVISSIFDRIRDYQPSPKSMGYYSHTNPEAVQFAESILVQEAMPKSSFVQQIEGWFLSLESGSKKWDLSKNFKER